MASNIKSKKLLFKYAEWTDFDNINKLSFREKCLNGFPET
jgi:hypothetical protein